MASYTKLTLWYWPKTSTTTEQTVGLIYRHLYGNCSSSTLLTLVVIRPLLEYGSVICDPISPTLISSIESSQRCALKFVSKSWSTDYYFLLSQFCLSMLERRRKIAKVTLIFKLKLNLMHSPTCNSPFRSPPPPPYYFRHYDPHTCNCLPIICKTHSFSILFYPSAIKLWLFLLPSNPW